MSRWLRYAGTVVLLAAAASCRPQDGNTSPAPFPIANSTVFPTVAPGTNMINSSSSRPPPNPCFDGTFLAPEYQVENLTVTKSFYSDDVVAIRGWQAVIKFTLRDRANNYSLVCTYGPANDDFSREWKTDDCVPESDPVPTPSPQTVTLLQIHPEFLAMNRSSQDPIRLVKYWYCDIANGSYPQVYQSRLEFFLHVTCPLSGKADHPSTCLVSTPIPLHIANSQWQPTGALPGTSQLVPKITAPVLPSRGLSPPPSKDCSDMSLTHPDWEMSGFSFTPPHLPYQYETANLSLTLKSRASGARVVCRFGGENMAMDRDWQDVYLPACTPEPAQQADYRSKFTVGFNLYGSNALAIREEWVCGDTAGRYSTNFTAVARVVIATYRSGNNTLLADPMLIHGTLPDLNNFVPARIPAPPGASTPGCTARSQSNREDVFTVTKFLYQATNISTAWPYGTIIGGTPYYPSDSNPWPHNRTLQIEFRNEATGLLSSCTFSDPVLNSPYDETLASRWWPCPLLSPAPPPSGPQKHSFPVYEVQSHFNFNFTSRVLRLNQTWFCNDTQSAAPYRFRGGADGSYFPSTLGMLVAGRSVSTAEHVQCGVQGAWQFPVYCDVTYTARWLSLGGDREGRGSGMGLRGQGVSQKRMEGYALTSPDPAPGRWSCTVASLGRGPVVWKLDSTAYGYMVRTSPWFGQTAYKFEPLLPTKLRFDLLSSVFADRPGSKGGAIRGIAMNSYLGYYNREGFSHLTPWLEGWDPARTWESEDRFKKDRYYYDQGWDFYEFLGWRVRFDIAKGYMELEHSWYCDDKGGDTVFIFNATWNGYVPMNCSYSFGDHQEGGISCLPPGGGVTVTPTVKFYTTQTAFPEPNYYALV